MDSVLVADETTSGRSSDASSSARDEKGDSRSSDSDVDSSGDEDIVDGVKRADPEHDYVLTAPPHTVRLNPTDRLYVIATTDWAWMNVPEMIELRKTSAVICLQRQFRARADRRKEEERDEKLAEFAGRQGAQKDVSLSQITFRKRRGSQGNIMVDLSAGSGGRDSPSGNANAPPRSSSPSPQKEQTKPRR